LIGPFSVVRMSSRRSATRLSRSSISGVAGVSTTPRPHVERGDSMGIFLTGATGFIGGHILRMLSAQGYEVTCLVRPASRRPTTARQPLEALPGVRIVEGEWTRPESWLNSVAGNEMVINAIGIIRESRLA